MKFTHRLINAWSELPASPRGSDAARSPFGERRGTRVECGACGGPLQHGRSTSMTRRVRRYVGLTKTRGDPAHGVESHDRLRSPSAREQRNSRGQRLLRIPDPAPGVGSPKWRMGIFELMVRDRLVTFPAGELLIARERPPVTAVAIAPLGGASVRRMPFLATVLGDSLETPAEGHQTLVRSWSRV